MNKKQRGGLVTGANKGIGFEIARQLGRERFRVFLGARNQEGGEAAGQKLNKELVTGHSSQVTLLAIDIADPNSVRAAAEEFGKQSDRLDALINNAGILLDDDKAALSMTSEIFETTIRTNTLGALLVSQA